MSDAIQNQVGMNQPQATVPDMNKVQTESQLRDAAKQFESMFMDIVMKSMRETVQDSDLLDGGEKSKFFQSMLDQEYSKLSTDGKGLGLADAIVRQFSQGLIGKAKGE